MIPVILAGGIGSRLWPLSRDLYPKQLLSLIGEQSLLQATIARVLPLSQSRRIIIVCGEQHQFLVEEQLEAMQETTPFTWSIILEPIGRNTAPALALAALDAQSLGDHTLLALPADHLISDPETFNAQIQQAFQNAQDHLITFGVKPSYPETGYGYIEVADRGDATGARKIQRFIEKPDKLRAEAYLQKGNYFWNSGIFLFRAATYLQELHLQVPEVLEVCEQAWQQRVEREQCIAIDAAIYLKCPNISIDYAIMEKTQLGMMYPLGTAWNDIGSWVAVSTLETPDEHGNINLGDVFSVETQNCYMRSESRLVTVVGVKDQIIVETPDAVLVADKAHAQSVKTLVEQLKSRQRKEVQSHATLYHPWGHYEIVCQGEEFVVEQVTIKPKATLTAQAKADFSEHWVVLSGIATIHRGEEAQMLSITQFADILPHQSYCVVNPTDQPVKLLNIRTHVVHSNII